MKPRLLIIGCGNVVTRALPWLRKRFRIYVLTRHKALSLSYEKHLYGDLDKAASLKRAASLAQYIIYAAPPAAVDEYDARVKSFIQQCLAANKNRFILAQSRIHIVYISTSGVYGDCAGERINEARTPNPQHARARRRLDAEKQWRQFALSQRVGLTILRTPGIYAGDRLPLARLTTNLPVMHEAEDHFSNHIHADDLARIIDLVLFRAPKLRVYHACDNEPLLLGEYFTLIARAAGLPIPIRASKNEVQRQVSPAMWSFMRESRQLSNQRLLNELRFVLNYPTINTFLKNYLPV